jgi:glycosyltransferase involved in cell wall biosynthesis
VVIVKSRFDILWPWRLLQEVRRINPDIIMTHGFNAHFAAMIISLLSRKSYTYACSYHGGYHAPSRLKRLVGPCYNAFTEYYIRNRARCVVTVAEYCKRHLVAHGVEPDKITVIHNGIESESKAAEDSRERIRREWHVRQGEILIGVASRLDPVKGLKYLLTAFATLATELEKLRLVLVGTGTQDEQLKNEVESLGLTERVIFTGFRSDVSDCLAAFDIFVLPSIAEYHSIALLEAMRAGKSIIATDVGGNTESVRDMQEALVVPAEDSRALAAAINTLAGDEELRLRLARAARQRFEENFTIEQMLQCIAVWFSDCK